MPDINKLELISGIKGGSWLKKSLSAKVEHRPDFFKPIPLGTQAFEKGKLLKKNAQKLRWWEKARNWWLKGPSFWGYTNRQWWAIIGSFLMFVTLTMFVILEGKDVINVIGPTFKFPPSPPPPPPVPTIPPLPPQPPSPPPSPKNPPHGPTIFVIDSSTCTHVIADVVVILYKNNICEDGGVGSVSSICAIGTDYPDCPQRTAIVPSPPPFLPPTPWSSLWSSTPEVFSINGRRMDVPLIVSMSNLATYPSVLYMKENA